MFEHFPYTNMHELNLDWIIEQVKKAYSPDNPPDNLVLSVNGQTGEVVLYKDANIQLPSVESNQWNIYRLVSSPNGQTARGIEFSGNGTARIINGTHRALIYTSENPPDYPVDSVNGQTGAVTIQVPFVNTTDELMQFATDSEDNYWGLRRNTTGGEAGIYLDTAGKTVRAYITLMPEYEGEGTPQTFQLLTTNDIPESSGVVSVNGLTGVVRLFGTNIYRTDNSNQTLNQAISTLENSTNSLNTRTGALETDSASLKTRATALEGTASALEDGIAIVANGNTHPSISSGQFVYIKNHPSLTEGLYTANSAIGTNAELTTSNVTADGSGGLNALKAKIGNVGNTDLQSQVTSLNSKFATDYPIKNKASTYGTHSSFTVENVTSNDAYLLFGASGTVAPFCYLISVAGGKVVVNMIIDPYGITVTGTISNNTLTINFSPSVTTIIKCVGLH